MSRSRALAIGVLALAFASLVCARGTVLSPTDAPNPSFEAVPFDEPDALATVFAALVGPLAVVEPFLANMPNLTGYWVIFPAGKKIFDAERPGVFKRYAAAGAIGFIQSSYFVEAAVLGSVTKVASPMRAPLYPPHFPIVAVKPSISKMLLELLVKGEVVLNVTDADRDPWPAMRSGLPLGLYMVSLAPVAIINIVLATRKLIVFGKSAKERDFVSVATVCLILEVAANILRLVALLFDPLFAFAIIQETVLQVLLTSHISFSLTTSLLICLYWYELLGKTKLTILSSKVSFLQRMKLPFCVIVAIMFSVELASSIPRGIPSVTDLSVLPIIAGVIYVLLTLSTSIFFFWNGFRVLDSFQTSEALRGRNSRLLKTTKLIMASGAFSLCLLVGEIIPITPAFWTPPGWAIAWWFVYFSCLWTSFLQISAFHTPTRVERSLHQSQVPSTVTHEDASSSSLTPPSQSLSLRTIASSERNEDERDKGKGRVRVPSSPTPSLSRTESSSDVEEDSVAAAES